MKMNINDLLRKTIGTYLAACMHLCRFHQTDMGHMALQIVLHEDCFKENLTTKLRASRLSELT
jgi:hypothetical protein